MSWDADGNTAKAGALAANKVRTATWWQPKASSDYLSKLRRYSEGDRVRGCNLLKKDNGGLTAVVTADFTCGSPVVLAGATTLATAVALGAAALAF